jgi:hypothetical protein
MRGLRLIGNITKFDPEPGFSRHLSDEVDEIMLPRLCAAAQGFLKTDAQDFLVGHPGFLIGGCTGHKG